MEPLKSADAQNLFDAEPLRALICHMVQTPAKQKPDALAAMVYGPIKVSLTAIISF